MTQLTDELILRLRSRTLLEWRIPVTAPEFSGILTTLAKDAGVEQLVEREEILRLDESGYLVEYLLDLRNAPRYEQPDVGVPILGYLLGRDARELLARNTLQNSPEERAWPQGPSRAAFWRDVLSGLGSSNLQVSRNATRCLAAVMVPFDVPLREEYYAQLAPRTRSQDFARPLLWWISRVRRSSSSSLLLLVTVFCSIVSLLLARSLIDTKLFVLAASLILCFSIVIAGMMGWKMIHLDLKRIYGGFYTVGLRGEASLLAGASSMVFANEQVTSELGGTIERELATLCGCDARVFRCILNAELPKVRWGLFALKATGAATREVIRGALAQLRNPALPGEFKRWLLYWLMTVRVVDEDYFAEDW
jgi:hypothetical protein